MVNTVNEVTKSVTCLGIKTVPGAEGGMLLGGIITILGADGVMLLGCITTVPGACDGMLFGSIITIPGTGGSMLPGDIITILGADDGMLLGGFTCFRYNNRPWCRWRYATRRFYRKEKEVEMSKYHTYESHCSFSKYVDGLRLSATMSNTEYSRSNDRIYYRKVTVYIFCCPIPHKWTINTPVKFMPCFTRRQLFELPIGFSAHQAHSEIGLL